MSRSSISPQFQPYHPLLPTIEQVNNEKKEFLSDHLPITAQIPLVIEEKQEKKESQEKTDTLNMVSWNIHSPKPKEESGFFVLESPKKSADRGQRILNSLGKWITSEKLKLDVIFLQDAFFDNPELPKESKLEESLTTLLKNNNWDMQKKNLMVTLYNTARLKRVETNTPEMKKSEEKKSNAHEEEFENRNLTNRTLTSTFQLKTTPSHSIVLHNVQWSHTEIPSETETQIRKLFSEIPPHTTAVVGGEFNSPMVVDEDYQITSVIPAYFGEEIYQFVEWSNAFVYQTKNQFHQIRERLHPETDELLKSERPNMTGWTNQQRMEVNAFFAPCVGITETLSAEKLFDKDLANSLASDGILLNFSVTAMHETRIAIQFLLWNSSFFKMMKDYFRGDKHIHITEYKEKVIDRPNVIHIPNDPSYKEKFTFLYTNEISITKNRLLLNKAIEKIETSISILQKETASVVKSNKVIALQYLLEQITRWYRLGGFAKGDSIQGLIADLKKIYPDVTAGMNSRAEYLLNRLMRYDTQLTSFDRTEYKEAHNKIVLENIRTEIAYYLQALGKENKASSNREQKRIQIKKYDALNHIHSQINQWLQGNVLDETISFSKAIKSYQEDRDVISGSCFRFFPPRALTLLRELKTCDEKLYREKEKPPEEKREQKRSGNR